MNEIALIFWFLGIFAVIFGIWTILGLCFYKQRKIKRKRKILLGVCADFSQFVGIPLWLVRLYALVYSPFIIGIVFYLLYYLVMRSRPRKKTIKNKNRKSVQITRMESRHYR